MKDIIIFNPYALGDTVCLSALVRDINRTHSGKYRVLLDGHYQSFWQNNPYCALAGVHACGPTYKPDYLDGIRSVNERGVKKHFLSWFHHDFELKLGIHVPVTEPKGDIWLSEEEKKPKYPGRYWVVVAGGKQDMTTKVWYIHRFQEVVDRLAKEGIRFIQSGADFRTHFHPRLKNCECSIGATDSIRDLFSLIYNCEGVLCGITGAMHIAAVFDKPCVVLAGGRELPVWEAYTNTFYPDSFGPQCAPVKIEQTYLHTIGLLDCGVGNLTKGCWKDRVVPLDQADLTNAAKVKQLCKKPLRTLPQIVPECMQLITTENVLEAVLNYYEKGVLPPLSKPLLGKPPEPEVNIRILNPVTSPPTEYELFDLKGNFLVRAKDYLNIVPRQDLQIWADKIPAEVITQPDEDPELAILDHPYLGGKMTVCICCHGDYLSLIQRCLTSIIDHIPSRRLDLRVALNQPSEAVLDYMQAFPQSVITKLYVDRNARTKYPAMREMFWDASCPITTPYVTWFDDDSWAIDRKWLVQLGREIVANQIHQIRLYGTKYLHDLMHFKKNGFSPEKWFREAPWYRNVWFKTTDGKREAPNGSVIEFVTGGFWCIALEMIRLSDIPDIRLGLSGGDIVIGEQVHQAGGKIHDFSRGKKPVCWSDALPRGASPKSPKDKVFPWATHQ